MKKYQVFSLGMAAGIALTIGDIAARSMVLGDRLTGEGYGVYGGGWKAYTKEGKKRMMEFVAENASKAKMDK
jgi:hypothetical protein